MSKERKRSRSRSRSRDKKEKKKRRHSTSSSDSSRSPDRFQAKLDNERAERKKQKKLEKQRLKDKETPEEKRARRLAKKEKKKKDKKEKESEGYLPPTLSYTNLNNPFNDNKLTETFVWGKKLESEGRNTVSHKTLEKEARKRVQKNVREMEDFKRARDARIAAREDRDMIQRDLDRRAHGDWDSKERQFQLEQVKVRTKLRIEQNRAKPIDLLSRYITYGEDSKADDEDEFELQHPATYVLNLGIEEYEDLIEDIKVYRSLDETKSPEFWKDVRCIIDDELKKLKADSSRSEIHNSVQAEVLKMFKGSNLTELLELESGITSRINNPGPGVDVAYWEAVLEQLKVHIAKTRLKQLHQSKIQLKLKLIRDENERQIGTSGQVTKAPKIMRMEDTEEIETTIRRKVNIAEFENDDLDEQELELKWRSLAPEQLEFVTLELYERGGYSPVYLKKTENMPGIEILEEDADRDNLLAIRQRNRKNNANDSLIENVDSKLLTIAKQGMEGDESMFSVEAPIDTQTLLWSDKYRPRKPTYLNRVQTGFDWNKYNQTHYDMDNPPPKIVQGYKFNIFYPDLLDKRETPSFSVTPCDDKDFAIIRFKSGPPYEDIAFKVVNREWEVSHKNGYKSQFQNGVFQLWFQFKKYRYRR
ncbi:unnamed protein product [Auanema sp. JU1783]|nr:unnamed protein product [Auanema sp. JU1783]